MVIVTSSPLYRRLDDGYERHDLADFAQEFLRRDPDYRAFWLAATGDHMSREEAGGLARRWGLIVPFRSRFLGSPASRIVASNHGCGHRRACHGAC